MTCPSCGHENRETARFCGECTAPLVREIECPECGTPNPAGQKFCDSCTHPLAAKGPSPSSLPAAAPRDPRAYTPKHLADKILRAKSAVEGERKQVTVLFADLQRSMDLQQQMDAERWHGIIEPLLGVLAEGVHRFEGTVNQYTGDGIMALFGAPIAHEDHARRAGYAALHLREHARAYAEGVKRSQGVSFGVRIGLNSGEVVVGKIGDDLRMDYTAQGFTASLADRMQRLADPGTVYLSDHTQRLVEGYFQVRDLGDFEIQGVAEPIRVHELEGVGSARTRLDISRARGFSRFVGRVDEMESLELALNRTEEGDGQVVGVVGQAGVGKSRLCLQFAEQCRARGIRVLEAHCPAHGKTVPLLPILELLRDAFGITSEDTDQAAREKIAGRLLLLDRAFDDGLPLVFDFLGVPDPEEPPPQMDPEARQRQLYRFLRRLVHARSEREPAILLFDDIQWIDEGSDACLAQLVEATSGTRTLLLANFRPEYRAEWIGRSYYQQLPLSPLRPEAIHELLHELLGSDPTLAGLHDLICERTGGNPFFIEEVVQSLAESESLSGTRGAYRLVTPVEELAIPATVQAVLAARIDRLPEREKQVLQTAAVATVLDKRFSESLLGRVAGLPGADLAAALGRLQADELIVEEALYPELEYVFKHPLTQSVAYDTQLSDRRAGIHAALARALVGIHAEKHGEHAALIAHHWEQAGEALEAARWHLRAAEWVGLHDPVEALRHLYGVRALLGSVPESSEVLELGINTRIRILHLSTRMGVYEHDPAEIFAEGKVLAAHDETGHLLPLLISVYALSRASTGDLREGHSLATKGYQLAIESGDRSAEFVCSFCLMGINWIVGRTREALTMLERLEHSEPEEVTKQTAIGGLGSLEYIRALIYAFSGRLDSAKRGLDRIIELAREQGDLEMLARGHHSRVTLSRFTGDLDPARVHAARALEASERLGSPRILALGYYALGEAALGTEDWGEAERVLEQALEAYRRSGTRVAEAQFLANLAEAHLGAGDETRAHDRAAEAIESARRCGSDLFAIHAELVTVRLLLGTGGASAGGEIEAHIREAERLIEGTGAASFKPLLLVERAELARLLGDDATRERHLRKSHRLFVEMGATGHAERVARELEELGVSP